MASRGRELPWSGWIAVFLLLCCLQDVSADTLPQAAQWCDKTINVCVAVAVPGTVSLVGQTLLANVQMSSTSLSASTTVSIPSSTSNPFDKYSKPSTISSSTSSHNNISTIQTSSSAVSKSSVVAVSSTVIMTVTTTPSAPATSILALASSTKAASTQIKSTSVSSIKSAVSRSASLAQAVVQTKASTIVKSSSRILSSAATANGKSTTPHAENSKITTAPQLATEASITLWWTQSSSDPWWTQSGGPFDQNSKRAKSLPTATLKKIPTKHTARALPSPSQESRMEDTTGSYNWIYYTVVLPVDLAWFAFGPDNARILVVPNASGSGNQTVLLSMRDQSLQNSNPSIMVQTVSGTGFYQSSSNGTLTATEDGTGDFIVVYLRQAMLNGTFIISNTTTALSKRDVITTSANAAAGLQAYNYAFGAVTPDTSAGSNVQVSQWAGQGSFMMALGSIGGAPGPFSAQQLVSTGQVAKGRSPWRMMVIAHAFFMILAFAILLPIGVLLAQSEILQEKLKKCKTWHWITQSVASFIALVGFVLGFVAAAGNRAVGAHQVIGCLIFALLLVQVSSGIARKRINGHGGSHAWLNRGHQGLAYLILFFAWINVGLGLALFGASKGAIVAWYILTALLVLTCLGYHFWRKRRLSKGSSKSPSTPKGLWLGSGVGQVAEKDPYDQWHQGGRDDDDYNKPNISYLENENDEDILHRERTQKWREADGADLGSRNARSVTDFAGGVRHWAASARRIMSGGYIRTAPDSPSKLEKARQRREHSDILSTGAYGISEVPFKNQDGRASCMSIEGMRNERFGLVITNPSSTGHEKDELSDPFADDSRLAKNEHGNYEVKKAGMHYVPSRLVYSTTGDAPAFSIVPASLPTMTHQARRPGEGSNHEDDNQRPLSPTKPGVAGLGAGRQVSKEQPQIYGNRFMGPSEYHDPQSSSKATLGGPSSGALELRQALHKNVVHEQMTGRESQRSSYSQYAASDRTSISSHIIHSYADSYPADVSAPRASAHGHAALDTSNTVQPRDPAEHHQTAPY